MLDFIIHILRNMTMGKTYIEDLPQYTYKDYQQWEGLWELIYGIPHAMSPAPSIQHQQISQQIAVALNESLENCDECQALLPVDWKIDENTVVQPDNLIVCGKPNGNFLTKAPALIFEILSQSTEKKDSTTKFRLYEKEGVKHYIMVDPNKKIAHIYSLHEGRYSKRMDATEETCEFDLGVCQITFNFARAWA